MDKKRDDQALFQRGIIGGLEAHLCIHMGYCFEGLPQVFDPYRKPWIEPVAASTQAIKDQVPFGRADFWPPKNSSAGPRAYLI